MSEDLIKKSDAIKALEREKSDWNNDYNVPIDNCIERLNKVKSADLNAEFAEWAKLWFKKELEADRPQGEWETVGKNHTYKRCPFCKRARAFTDTRFCDWCGARMKGADDD